VSPLSSTPEDRTVVQFVRRRRMPATAVAALLAAREHFALAGTDIHLRVEVRRADGTWMQAKPPFRPNPDYRPERSYVLPPGSALVRMGDKLFPVSFGRITDAPIETVRRAGKPKEDGRRRV
jgi:hypothetical protein